MFVKPTPGRKVRWPNSMRSLSEQGENVPNDLYWNRLVQTGNVVIQDTPATILKVRQASKSGKKENKDG